MTGIIGGRLSWAVAAATAVVGAALLAELALRAFPSLLPRAAWGHLPDRGVALTLARPGPWRWEEELGFVPTPHLRLRYRRSWDLVTSGDLDPARTAADPRWIELETDADGFRNPPGAPPAEMAVVGDSFVQGQLVARDDLWTTVLEGELGRPVRNLGVAGYGPQQALGVIRRFVLPARPRVVVWAFFCGNDVRDAGLYSRFRASGLPWPRFEQSLAGTPPERPWIDGSRLLATWRALRIGPRPDRQPSAAALAFNPVCADPAADAACPAFGDDLLLRETLSPAQWTADPGWEPTVAALRAARELTRDAGVELVVVFLPSKEAIELPLLAGAYSAAAFEAFVAAAARLHGVDPGGETWQARFDRHHGVVASLVGAVLDREGVPWLDLAPAFATAAARERLYFPFDSHWNEAGNALAGRAVAAFLEERSRSAEESREPGREAVEVVVTDLEAR